MYFKKGAGNWGGFSSADRSGRLVIGRLLVQNELHVVLSLDTQDTEPWIAPDVQLAPYLAASAVSERPAMSWRLVQGVPRPEKAGIGSSKNPHDPIKGIKQLQTMDGWSWKLVKVFVIFPNMS